MDDSGSAVGWVTGSGSIRDSMVWDCVGSVGSGIGVGAGDGILGSGGGAIS